MSVSAATQGFTEPALGGPWPRPASPGTSPRINAAPRDELAPLVDLRSEVVGLDRLVLVLPADRAQHFADAARHLATIAALEARLGRAWTPEAVVAYEAANGQIEPSPAVEAAALYGLLAGYGTGLAADR